MVLFYFNHAPDRCGASYGASTPVPSSLWYELSDISSGSQDFRVDPGNVLNNGPSQFPSGDTFFTTAINTNSAAPSSEIEFVISEAGVFVGGDPNTSPTYHYTFTD